MKNRTPKYRIKQEVYHVEYDFAYIADRYFNENLVICGFPAGFVYLIRFEKRGKATRYREVHEDDISFAGCEKLFLSGK